MPADPKPPQGVVVVLVDDAGRVVAHGADFDEFRPGGFNLRHAQKMRAALSAARAFVASYGSPLLTAGLDDYDPQEIVARLIRKERLRERVIDIGHEEASDAA